MKLFLKRTSVILMVFITLSIVLSACSLWSLRQSSFYKPSFLVNDVKEKEFDYIILGASTGLTTLNTKTIDSVLKTNGLNLAMDDTALGTQYVMLQHFLQQGKSAKAVILAPSAYGFDSKNKDISDNDYRFLPYINESYVSDYFEGFSSHSSKIIHYSEYIPMFGVSYYNVEILYPSLMALVKPKKRNRFDERGNYTYPNTQVEPKQIQNFESITIGFKNTYFKKIKALCESHNIRLICYFSPMKAKKVKTTVKDLTIINHSDLLKNEALFYDDIHVNSNGRYVTSLAFAKDFQESF